MDKYAISVMDIKYLISPFMHHKTVFLNVLFMFAVCFRIVSLFLIRVQVASSFQMTGYLAVQFQHLYIN